MRKIDFWTTLTGCGMGLCAGMLMNILVIEPKNELAQERINQCTIGFSIGLAFWLSVAIFVMRRIYRDASDDHIRGSNWLR